MKFGSNVVKLRKEQGISQTALAVQLGIHKIVLGGILISAILGYVLGSFRQE